jgi:hypothetical protein
MTEGLGELLRRGADTVAAPRLDLGEVVAEASRRRRRRRLTMIAGAAVTVGVVVAGSVVAVGNASRTSAPSPADSPAPSRSSSMDAPGSRPLVYADGRTVHVGDKTIQADKPVAFIAPTDDGAVYEATLDGTLWFTDGASTEVIGTSGYTAAPTSHAGVVLTGRSGSLVVWADQSRSPRDYASPLVVYDTSRRREVARIPAPERGRAAYVAYVGEAEVWYGFAGGSDRHVYRLDVSSGATTPLNGADLDAALNSQARVFTAVAGDGQVVHGSPWFAEQENGRLTAGIHYSEAEDDAAPVRLSDGSQLRLRLPPGYVGPWPKDEQPALAVSQWLDDDHVVLWARDGGGDLPAMSGDFLVCRLPDGVCHVAVTRTSHRYVAPYLS